MPVLLVPGVPSVAEYFAVAPASIEDYHLMTNSTHAQFSNGDSDFVALPMPPILFVASPERSAP